MILILITAVIITLIAMFLWRKNTIKRFNELLSSDRYKNSRYIIYKINNNYALRIGDYFVDLKSNWYTWDKTDKHFKDCIGTKMTILRVFNYVNPIETEIKEETRL